MAKKKKNQTQEGLEAPVNQTAFSEPTAAQGAAVSSQTSSQPANSQPQSQLPADVVELIRATLRVLIAQRKTHGLATTLTSLTKAVKKALDKYLKRIPTSTVREFIKSELMAMGHPVISAVIEYGSELYQADLVMLYRNYDELVEMIKAGRVNSVIKPLIVTDGIDPLFDKAVKGKAHV